jgi:hypothetical protein
MKNIFVFFWKSLFILISCLTIILFQGCGLIGILGTESSYEKKVPAEVKLIKDKKSDNNRKLLVLVKQPSWLNAPPLLGQLLTEQIQLRLVANAALKFSNLISEESLSKFRGSTPNFYSMTTLEIGKAMNADWVLVVELTSYRLFNISDTEYFGGGLAGKAFVIDTADTRQLWPDKLGGEQIEIAFDVEKRGNKAALARLAAAYSHCVTRYFYDCPRRRFKIADEKTVSEIKQWGY